MKPITVPATKSGRDLPLERKSLLFKYFSKQETGIFSKIATYKVKNTEGIGKLLIILDSSVGSAHF